MQRSIGLRTRSIGPLIAGVRSNVAFLGALCRAPEFRKGKVDTGFIDRNLAALGAVPRGPDHAAAALGVARLLGRESANVAAPGEDPAAADSPWAARDGFQLSGMRAITVPVVIEGERASAAVTYDSDGMHVAIDGTTPAVDASVFEAQDEVYVLRHGRQTRVRLQDVSIAAAEAGTGDGVIKAPMHGKVLELFVRPGEPVAGGPAACSHRSDEDGTHAACAVCRRRRQSRGRRRRASCGRRRDHGDRAGREG